MDSKKYEPVKLGSSSTKYVAVGLGPEQKNSFVFGVQYEFDKEQIAFERAYQKGGYEFAPLRHIDNHSLLYLPNDKFYFIGTTEQVNNLVTYHKADQFGDSAYRFKDGNIYGDDILTLFEPIDVIIMGYYIVHAYGEFIDIYERKNGNDMFVIIKNIIPGSEHVVHFINKKNDKLFADFMNRYSYVNW